MPLSMANIGESVEIIKINGKDEVRSHLSELGFVPGTKVMKVSDNNGNMIVQVRDARIALSTKMANRIMV